MGGKLGSWRTCLLLASGNLSLSNCRCTRLPLRPPSCSYGLTTSSLEARRKGIWELKDQLLTMEQLLLTCLRCKKRLHLPFLTFHDLVMILSPMLVLCNTLTKKDTKKAQKKPFEKKKKKKKKKKS